MQRSAHGRVVSARRAKQVDDTCADGGVVVRGEQRWGGDSGWRCSCSSWWAWAWAWCWRAWWLSSQGVRWGLGWAGARGSSAQRVVRPGRVRQPGVRAGIASLSHNGLHQPGPAPAARLPLHTRTSTSLRRSHSPYISSLHTPGHGAVINTRRLPAILNTPAACLPARLPCPFLLLARSAVPQPALPCP